MKPIDVESPTEFFQPRQIIHSEKNTVISTNHITHFTDKFSVILEILKNGFRPSFCDESQIYKKEYEELETMIRFIGSEPPTIEDVSVPMVCFCDIPLKYSFSQRKLYGKYGISLKKDWAMSKWITPVTYVAENTKNHALLFAIYSLIDQAIAFHRTDKCNTEDNPPLINLQQELYKLRNFIKPYYNSLDNRKFYDEREWRYVPDNFYEEDHENIEKYLKFELRDIYQIIVTSSHEKKIVLRLLEESFQIVPKTTVKIRNKIRCPTLD